MSHMLRIGATSDADDDPIWASSSTFVYNLTRGRRYLCDPSCERYPSLPSSQ
jgi:hypothetical protein